MANRAVADEQAPAPPSAPAQRSAPARRSSTLAQLRRDENGLTTLEWLLIVAAVAGLAALAVVLVTNVVSSTADQIEGRSARLTAAAVAAADITTRARAVDADDDPHAIALNTDYKGDCNLLRVTYSDIEGLMVFWSANITAHPGTPVTAESDVTTESDWDGDQQGCVAYTS